MQTYKEALHDDDIKDNAVVVEKVLIIKDLWDALDKTDVAIYFATMIPLWSFCQSWTWCMCCVLML